MVDWNRLDDGELRKFRTAWLGLSLMRAVASNEVIEWATRNGEEFAGLLQNEPESAIFTLSYAYILSVTDEFTRDHVYKVVTDISPKANHATMTVAETLVKQGQEKGLEMSIVKMLKKSFDPKLIAETLEVPLARVLEIQKSLPREPSI